MPVILNAVFGLPQVLSNLQMSESRGFHFPYSTV